MNKAARLLKATLKLIGLGTAAALSLAVILTLYFVLETYGVFIREPSEFVDALTNHIEAGAPLEPFFETQSADYVCLIPGYRRGADVMERTLGLKASEFRFVGGDKMNSENRFGFVAISLTDKRAQVFHSKHISYPKYDLCAKIGASRLVGKRRGIERRAGNWVIEWTLEGVE